MREVPFLLLTFYFTKGSLKVDQFDSRWTIPLTHVHTHYAFYTLSAAFRTHTVQRFSRAGPRGRAREWVTLGVHPLSWLLSNNRLEEVCGTLTKGTFSSRLLLSNQDKGCTPSVAHSLPLPQGFCSTCLFCTQLTHPILLPKPPCI